MSTKTVAFFGASGGCGLSALKHTLAAGHTCVALCRSPAKLAAVFPPEKTPNLTIIEGNAHDTDAVAKCLVKPQGNQLVDAVVFTVGGLLNISKMTLDDPDVCKKGISTLLEALSRLRAAGAAGASAGPRLAVISSTGISNFGRDVPLAMIPMYHVLLKVPHADKKVMEQRLVESGEAYTIVRPSFLVDGETDKRIRVGVEDPKAGRESKAVGYTISREDVGRWMAENLVLKESPEYLRKIVTITY